MPDGTETRLTAASTIRRPRLLSSLNTTTTTTTTHTHTHTTFAMALKRINKELSDLGRYVHPQLIFSPHPALVGGAVAQAGFLATFIIPSFLSLPRSGGYMADLCPVL